MNLWLSTQFLVAGLFLSSWALTPEECRPLITPLSLKPSMVSLYLSGFVYKLLALKQNSDIWEVLPQFMPLALALPLPLVSFLRNGTCLFSVEMINIQFLSLVSNYSGSFHMLPTCDDCLLYSFNRTATNLDKMFEKMELNINATAEETHYRGLYLMARGTTVKDSDLENFRKQASCLGFNREPDFIYDPKNDFCSECEGRKIPGYYN
uniref:Uncharacterized protein n=1 Tax=Cyclopterus lumpus TaxID=8103 RepID=A0A8C2WJK0_CYCLU